MARTCAVTVLFTEQEIRVLREKAARSHFPTSVYCREILLGAEVKEAPSADVLSLIFEMRRIGADLNMLLNRPEVSGAAYAEELRQSLTELRAAAKRISDAYAVNMP